MPTRRALQTGCALAALATLVPASPHAQQIGRAPVDVRVHHAPAPAVALGRVHLAYELHLTSFAAADVSLDRLDVLDPEGAQVATWTAASLWQRIRVIGQAPDGRQTLRPGQRAVVFLWVSLPPGVAAPGALVHRLTFAAGGTAADSVTAPPVRLPAPGMTTLAAPVRGGPWVAVRGPSPTSGHRLSLVAMDGHVRVPQRFAVDWAKLGDDGLLFRGDPADVANWYGYDEPVYAAAAGVVIVARDGAPDRSAMNTTPPAVMEAADAVGNVVVVDIGEGRFATYAHLKPGSLLVAEGERVVEGQALARIGNSGNTLGPHLHFHVSDAREPLASEGLPFRLRRFDLVGRVPALPALLAGTPWTPDARQPAREVGGEMPLENMVVRVEAESAADAPARSPEPAASALLRWRRGARR